MAGLLQCTFITCACFVWCLNLSSLHAISPISLITRLKFDLKYGTFMLSIATSLFLPNLIESLLQDTLYRTSPNPESYSRLLLVVGSIGIAPS